MNWFDRVPKVELHLHLEGAIPLPALWKLVRKYSGDAAVPNLTALERRFAYRDFPHFIEVWNWKNGFLREYQDFDFIAEAVARDLAAQNVRYAETFYSPTDFSRHGLKTQELTQAIRSGLDRVPQIEVALVADLVRDTFPQKAAVTLQEIHEVGELGVIGVGIGGSEQDYPPEPFAEVYNQARRLGFRTTAHAGEAAGAESVWGAIRALKIDRIGHGTRAIEDPALLDYLAEHKIPIEMCPLSNVCTGIVPAIEAHPIRHFFERGIPVTVNTDDPKMFGNSLAEEYRLLESKLGFTRDEVRTLILQGIRSSWLPKGRKRLMIEAFRQYPAWLA